MPPLGDAATTLAATADGAWVHNLNPVLLPIAGPFAVRWYGLAYLAGFAAAYAILRTLAARGTLRVPTSQVADALVLLVAGVVVGGRLGYAAFYKPSLFAFSSDPPFWNMLNLAQGGMASHGGMIGVAVAILIIARRHKAPFLHIADAAAFATPPGLFLGRVANFINGELLGRIIARPAEQAPWYAVRFPTELTNRTQQWSATLSDAQLTALDRVLTPVADRLAATTQGPPPIEAVLAAAVQRVQQGDDRFTRQLAEFLTARHPSQLYQALAEGVVLFAALAFVWRKPRRPGVVSAWFLIVYGIGRIATEFYRLPDTGIPTTLGLSRGQLLSAAMISAGLALLAFTHTRKHPRRPA